MPDSFPCCTSDPCTFTPEPTVPAGCSQAASKPNLFCPTWDSSNRQHLIEVSHWLGQNILTTALQGEALPSSLPCSLSPCLEAVSSCALVPASLPRALPPDLLNIYFYFCLAVFYFKDPNWPPKTHPTTNTYRFRAGMREPCSTLSHCVIRPHKAFFKRCMCFTYIYKCK